MDSPITRAEHEEFVRRMEAENKRLEDEDNRQNQRIAVIEDELRTVKDLAISVEKLAVNMERTLKELEKQGKRLSALEDRDGQRWRDLVWYILIAVVGVLGGVLVKQIIP